MSTIEGQHARHRLDPLIHAPVRLSIIAALAAVDEAEFGHLGKRPRSWLSLTSAGRTAYTAHLQALRAIAEEL